MPAEEKVKARRKRHKAQPVYRGDIWELLTNCGYLTRHVRSVTRDGTVSYIDSDDKFCQCAMTTFQRWIWSARLAFREDAAKRID